MSQLEKIAAQRLYHSGFYEIKNLAADFSQDSSPLQGYNDCFCLMLVKKGAWYFDVAKQSFALHTGHVLIDKPNYEYRLQATLGECTVLNFSNEFYARLMEEMHLERAAFFANRHMLTLLLQADPTMEYLHHRLLHYPYLSQIERDAAILELVNGILKRVSTRPVETLASAAKKFHLPIVERAKAYIHQQFQQDFSLIDLANAAYASPFHLSRIFKQYTGTSPHQYVLQVRLKHSEMLLKNCSKSIAEVAFESGFNHAEYFATAFKQKYGLSPSAYKQKMNPSLFPRADWC